MDNKTIKLLRLTMPEIQKIENFRICEHSQAESGTDESNNELIKKISEKYNIPVKGIIKNIHEFFAENEILKKYKM